MENKQRLTGFLQLYCLFVVTIEQKVQAQAMNFENTVFLCSNDKLNWDEKRKLTEQYKKTFFQEKRTNTLVIERAEFLVLGITSKIIHYGTQLMPSAVFSAKKLVTQACFFYKMSFLLFYQL